MKQIPAAVFEGFGEASCVWTGHRSANWTDSSRGEPVATAFREAGLSVSAHDVVAADPDMLAVPPAPVSWPPDVIRAAVPISGTSIIRSISDRDHHRASTIIWPGAIVATIAWITSVVICAACETKRGANEDKQHKVSRFPFHHMIIRIPRMTYAF
jgi:hypothetical protein